MLARLLPTLVLLLLGFGLTTSLTACAQQPPGSGCFYGQTGNLVVDNGKGTCPLESSQMWEVPAGSGCWFHYADSMFQPFYSATGGQCGVYGEGQNIEQPADLPGCWYWLYGSQAGDVFTEVSKPDCPDTKPADPKQPPGNEKPGPPPDESSSSVPPVESTSTSSSTPTGDSTPSSAAPQPSTSSSSSSTSSSSSSSSSTTSTTTVLAFTATATCNAGLLGVVVSGTGRPGAAITLTGVEPSGWRPRIAAPAATVGPAGTWSVTIFGDATYWFPFNAQVESSNGETPITVASPSC